MIGETHKSPDYTYNTHSFFLRCIVRCNILFVLLVCVNVYVLSLLVHDAGLMLVTGSMWGSENNFGSWLFPAIFTWILEKKKKKKKRTEVSRHFSKHIYSMTHIDSLTIMLLVLILSDKLFWQSYLV